MIVTYPPHVAWPMIATHVETVRTLTRETWRSEDVLRQLMDRDAFCYQFTNDESFFICKPIRSGNKKILFVWICYGENGALVNHTDEVIEIARNTECSAVEFGSRRKGYERMGWQVKNIIYRKEVPQNVNGINP